MTSDTPGRSFASPANSDSLSAKGASGVTFVTFVTFVPSIRFLKAHGQRRLDPTVRR
jgi:hypothetical protein